MEGMMRDILLGGGGATCLLVAWILAGVWKPRQKTRRNGRAQLTSYEQEQFDKAVKVVEELKRRGVTNPFDLRK
jgi:type II secretory pathway component PulM